jgi:hypothetical protein
MNGGRDIPAPGQSNDASTGLPWWTGLARPSHCRSRSSSSPRLWYQSSAMRCSIAAENDALPSNVECGRDEPVIGHPLVKSLVIRPGTARHLIALQGARTGLDETLAKVVHRIPFTNEAWPPHRMSWHPEPGQIAWPAFVTFFS